MKTLSSLLVLFNVILGFFVAALAAGMLVGVLALILKVFAPHHVVDPLSDAH